MRIYTDHLPLIYALNNKNVNFKLKRWKAFLEDFNYELRYKSGSTNTVADALSRPPKEETRTDTLPQAGGDTSQINALNESSSQNLLQYTDAPVNVFKNRIFITSDEGEPSYNLK